MPVPGRHGLEPIPNPALDARSSARTLAHISIVSDRQRRRQLPHSSHHPSDAGAGGLLFFGPLLMILQRRGAMTRCTARSARGLIIALTRSGASPPGLCMSGKIWP